MKDILFYYPQHFNRTKEGTNPFFNAMLDACDRNGIKYTLLEEPDGGTDKPRNPLAKKADTIFWTITVIRKLVGIIFPKKSFHWRERPTAKIFNLLTLGRFKYNSYITISGSMYHFFSHLNPKGNVFDMQHGILYKKHPTFFDEEKRLRPIFYPKNLHLLFWGKGYYDCFVKGEEKHLSGKAHVVGYPINSQIAGNGYPTNQPDTILVSLQFTNSLNYEGLEKLKAQLHRFIAAAEPFGKKILLKHHPRYNNCIPIDDILKEFKNVEITTECFEELTKKIFLHVTNSSTTAFEFAEYGIPTYFLIDGHDNGIDSRFFYEEYEYPLYRDRPIDEVLTRLENSQDRISDGNTVQEWYNKFYSPFDEEAFISLIR